MEFRSSRCGICLCEWARWQKTYLTIHVTLTLSSHILSTRNIAITAAIVIATIGIYLGRKPSEMSLISL
jgi:hypothetical protein